MLFSNNNHSHNLVKKALHVVVARKPTLGKTQSQIGTGIISFNMKLNEFLFS